MKYITTAAFAISVPLFVGAWFLPDLRLEYVDQSPPARGV